jgi:hypothetical protein
MARHGTLSRRPAKEQPPADMRDDKTANTIADQTHIPLPSLAPSIPCPSSDRCATAVPVGVSRRSAPAISRFCPVLGWRTMLQLLARRAVESNDFFGRDLSEVTSELTGHSKQQCKERYRLADTVAELTFVFIRVIFLGSPALRSSLVLTKVTDSADSARPIHYSTFDASPPSPAPSLSPTSSLTHVHRYIGSRNATRQTLPTSVKLTYLSVYDRRDGVSEHAASPSPPSSLMHVHRCIGFRNATRQTLSSTAKLTYLRVYDSRDGVSEHSDSPSSPSSLTHVHRDGVSERAASPSPPSLLTHVHRCIGSRKATRQTLPTSVKLKYLIVYDIRDGVSERAASPSPPSSLTHVHRCIGSRNATRQTLPTSAKLTSLSMCDIRNSATQCKRGV